MNHRKKILPEFYNDILLNKKRMDLRDKTDGYVIGETVTFMEYDGTLSGREIDVEITYLTDYGLMDGDIMVGFIVDEWLPIETAPCGDVLAYEKHYGKVWSVYNWRNDELRECVLSPNPTHWKPITLPKE